MDVFVHDHPFIHDDMLFVSVFLFSFFTRVNMYKKGEGTDTCTLMLAKSAIKHHSVFHVVGDGITNWSKRLMLDGC